MQIAILGGGSLGCIFAAHLDKAGHEVRLLARGRNLDALRRSGVTITDSAGMPRFQQYRVNVVENPEELGEFELGVVAVKAPDTRSLLDSVARSGGPDSVFFSLQNSFEKEELLESVFGKSRILGAVTTEGASMIEPGVVHHDYAGQSYLGEYPNGKTDRVEKIAEGLTQAGLATQAVDDVYSVKWAKLVTYSTAGVLSALTRLPLQRLLENPRTARLYVDLIKEGVSVMRVYGVEPRDYPPKINVRTLSEIDSDHAVEMLRNRAERMKEELKFERRVSLLQDILSGKETESEKTVGALLSLGERKGVRTPLFETAYGLLNGLEEASRMKSTAG